MNAGRWGGALLGATAAGLGLSAMMLAGERRNGKPSELAQLERSGAHRLGVMTPPPGRLPDTAEQAVVHGGHLALSVLAGAVYAAAVDEGADGIASGVAFGLGFYAVAHWLAGPLLGVKQAEWRAGAGTIAMHAANHVGFGLATAAGARLASAR